MPATASKGSSSSIEKSGTSKSIASKIASRKSKSVKKK